MGGTISDGRDIGQQAATVAEAGAGVAHRRSGWVAAGLMVVLAAAVVSVWRAGAFSSAASSGTGRGTLATATAVVTRQDLSATTPVP